MRTVITRLTAGSALLALLACGGGKTQDPPVAWTPTPQEVQAAATVVGSFVSIHSFTQVPSLPDFSVPGGLLRLPIPRVAAEAVLASCPTVTSTLEPKTLTLDFTGCPGAGGRIVYTLGALTGSSMAVTVAFQQFAYSYVSEGTTHSGTVHGTLAMDGTVATAGGTTTTTFHVVTATGGLALAGVSPAGSFAFTVTEDLTAIATVAGSSLTNQEYGTFTYTQGAESTAVLIPQTAPLVWNALSGCTYPLSGTLRITAKGRTLAATFGMPCGTLTLDPGRQTLTL